METHLVKGEFCSYFSPKLSDRTKGDYYSLLNVLGEGETTLVSVVCRRRFGQGAKNVELEPTRKHVNLRTTTGQSSGYTYKTP